MAAAPHPKRRVGDPPSGPRPGGDNAVKVGGKVDEAREDRADSGGRPQGAAPAVPRWMLPALIAFRVLNTFLIRTSFDPDEYWQGPEVAHRVAFGYGYLTWEWWPQHALRGFLHPLMFAAVYKALQAGGIDTPFLVRWSPRVVQAVFAAWGDLSLFRLAKALFPAPSPTPKWVLACQLLSWFNWFAFTRTYTSSLEAALTIAALAHWPFLHAGASQPGQQGRRGSRKLALCLAALATVIRPTSAMPWIFLGTWELLTCRDALRFVFLEVAPIGALAIALSVGLDSWMYGRWVLTPLNFLRFNFLTSGASNFGTHPWHWYLSQGLPATLLTLLPFTIAGMLSFPEPQLPLLVVWSVLLLSAKAHKEFRFLLPVIPLCNLFAGHGIALLQRRLARGQASPDGGQPTGKSEKKGGSSGQAASGGKSVAFVLIVGAAMGVQILGGLYFCLGHQGGGIAAITYLSREMQQPGAVSEVAFLMPCHATPFYAHTHSSTPMRILDCTPQFARNETRPHETQRLLADSKAFIKTWHEAFGNASQDTDGGHQSPHPQRQCDGEVSEGGAANGGVVTPLPSHIVVFRCEDEELKDMLDAQGYKEERRFFHAHVPVDRDCDNWVIIYRLQKQTASQG